MNNLDDLVENLAREATAVKPAPHPYLLGLIWTLGAVAYLAVSLLVSGLRPDLMRTLHEPWFLAEIVSLVLIFVSTTLSAAVLAFPDLHQMRRAAWSPAVAFTLFLVVMVLAWRADSPPAPFPVHSFECTVSIALFALLPALWTFFPLRKFATTHYRWTGSIALLSAFSVGALWLRLHEINDSILHVILWHYLPMLAIGLIGLWLGKKLLKW